MGLGRRERLCLSQVVDQDSREPGWLPAQFPGAVASRLCTRWTAVSIREARSLRTERSLPLRSGNQRLQPPEEVLTDGPSLAFSAFWVWLGGGEVVTDAG